MRLSVCSGKEAVAAFGRLGWRVDRQKGSHIIMLKEAHAASLSIPQHKTMAPGTLRSLIRNAGISVEEFAGKL
ncbi:MAG: type II toxin-antitoxin system HicA family toxin [Fimbriimonadales bacterium]